MEKAQLAAIDLFREKFEKLRRSSVWRALEQGQCRVSLHAEQGGPSYVTIEGPSGEAVDAFVLTLRFFLQNNEPISIGNMSEMFADLPVPPEAKQRVGEFRESFNAFLGRPCGININGLHPTNGTVLNTFVYGGMAHANLEKKEIFDGWARNTVTFGMMSQAFLLCLKNVLIFLSVLHDQLEAIS